MDLPTLTILAAILCPLAAGVVCLSLPRQWVTARTVVATSGSIGAMGLLGWFIRSYGYNHGVVGTGWMSSLRLDLYFAPDRLGLFFALLVTMIGFLVALYARAYFGPDRSSLYRFYPSFLLFMTAMLGLVLSDNFLLMLLFWELTSISSFLLIGWERDDQSAVKSALQAFIVTGTGGLALMAGLLLLGVSTGEWSFSGLASTDLAPNGTTLAAFLLIFLGAAAKSAQWPLHFWLPGAMAAPTPVSAYLHSATMVKAGVYLLARVADPLAQLPWWPWLLLPIGAITMVLGAYLAVRKTDLKLVFAYTTVSQLGLLVCVYGLSAYHTPANAAVVWDVTQILNHALYKAPLFLLAGAVAHALYTRDLRDLGGLFYQGKKERRLAILLLLAAYAMAAGPLTLGFAAKEFFFYGIYNTYTSTGQPAFLVLLAAAVCQGALNVALLVRIARIFLTPTDDSAKASDDTSADEDPIAYEDYHAVQGVFWSAMLWLPAAVLIGFQFVGGVAPGLFAGMFGDLERHVAQFSKMPGTLYFLGHPGVPLALSGVAIAAGLAMGFAPIWRRSIRDWHDRLFPLFYTLATGGSGRVFGVFQNGGLRTYVSITLLTLVLLIGWSASLNPHWQKPLFDTLLNESMSDSLPGHMLAGMVIVASAMLLWVKGRSARVVLLGVVGFLMTGVFYVYGAPDLALTQISIEIVSLLLFLLVLNLLPKNGVPPVVHARLPKLGRIAIAGGVGAVMFWLTVTSATMRPEALVHKNAEGHELANLGSFFLRNSYEGIDTNGAHPGGGGRNVVNVILVDFRGFDTFGELTVLALAAMGVWTLLRGRGDHDPQATLLARRLRASRAKVSLTVESLAVASRLLVPLSLLFSIYIYFKGHQSPGGGFVAGLVAAIAFLVHRMSYGRASLRHMLRVRERTLIGVGLLLVFVTGLGSLIVGKPFLVSRFGYLQLPGTNNYVEWTSVLVFDLGVMLLVAGVTMGIVNALTEELEKRTSTTFRPLEGT